MLKILFMGTPDFARESLKAVYEAGHKILGVVTNPDKQKGRGMKLQYSPVKEYSLEKGLKVYQPIKVKKNIEFIDEIRKINPDLICVVAYGKILPKEILDIPKYGCINVHASILPKYRGAAPIQWAIINGEKETGVTTMMMDEGMDTGDMLLTEKVKINENETTGELWDRLSAIGGKLLVETLEQIERGTVKRIKQSENFTVAPMLNKEMSKIDWNNKTAKEIKNLCRGLNPIMGIYSYIDDKKIKFWKVENISIEEFKKEFGKYEEKPGQIVVSNAKNGLYISAKDGIIKVIEIQADNSKKMNINDFLRGKELPIGKIFK